MGVYCVQVIEIDKATLFAEMHALVSPARQV